MSNASHPPYADPDADRLLREAAEAAGPIDTPVPLDYGHPEPRHQAVANNVNAAVARIGGWRQVACAVALALILGGLGRCLVRTYTQVDGADAMGLGGFILGLVIPVPARREPPTQGPT